MPISIALSGFDIATVIAMVGMLACRLTVLPYNANADLDRRLHHVLGRMLVLLTLASLGILLSRTLELGGGVWTALAQDLRPALEETHFGHVWVWRVPALVVLWVAWGLAARHSRYGRVAAWITLLAVAVIALTRSDTGHAGDHGDFTLSVWIDWLHLMAAGAWVGAVFGMTLVLFPGLLRDRESAKSLGAVVFQRLSTLSGVALAVVVGCGIYNAFHQLGSINALWTTQYGIALAVKLVLVLAMIGIGAHNRYVKLPLLQAASAVAVRPHLVASWFSVRQGPRNGAPRDVLRSCARAVLLESLLGVAVIGVTAVLIHAMPPGDMPPGAAPADDMQGIQMSWVPRASITDTSPLWHFDTVSLKGRRTFH